MDSAKKMIGLVRVSTKEQEESSLGLEAQTLAIKAECERKGWTLIDVVPEAAVSGRGAERPGLYAALEHVGSGEADGIVVAKLDRLSRSVVDFGRILAWLDQVGGHLVALDLGVDTSTPAGRLVANVLASVAQWEADTISARTSDALAIKRQRGEQVGRPSVDPDVVARIRELRETRTLQGVCDVLNDEKIPTTRGAAEWRVSAVQTALGYKRPKRKRPAALPPVPRRRAAA